MSVCELRRDEEGRDPVTSRLPKLGECEAAGHSTFSLSLSPHHLRQNVFLLEQGVERRRRLAAFEGEQTSLLRRLYFFFLSHERRKQKCAAAATAPLS